jgi:hypothetical protein
MADRDQTAGRGGTGDAGDAEVDASVGAGAVSGASMGDVGRVGLGGPGDLDAETGSRIGDDQNASAGAVGADPGGEGGKDMPPGSRQE